MAVAGRLPLKTVLVDLSGTLHIQELAVPGAQEALRRLQDSQLQVKFVTNTTKESKRRLFQNLTTLGFPVKQEDFVTSLSAAHDLVKKWQLKPMLIIDDAAMGEFEDVRPADDAELDSVVVGLAPDLFNYETLTKAFRVLLRPGARLVAVHQARYFARKDGLALGPGAFVKALEYSAGVQAHTVGKPSADFYRAALDGVEPEAAIMIGDDVNDDVAGAQSIGMRGILVRTGKYREGDEKKIDPPPAFVCEDFPRAVDAVLQTIAASS